MNLGGVIDSNSDIEAVDGAVDECFEKPLSCVSAEVLSARLVALTQVSAKIDALRVDTVAAARRCDVGSLNDQRNVANHVAGRTNADPSVVRADDILGRWLDDLPILADAYRLGQIHTSHLNALRLKDNPRCHRRLIADQARFVEWFTRCHFRDIDQILERWLLGADPDGAEPREAQERSGLSLRPLPGGGAKLAGRLDPLQAAALKTALHAEADVLRRKQDNADISSTTSRRMLDALLNLVSRGAARPDGSHPQPLVNIVVSQSVYEATLAWLADPANNDLPVTDDAHPDRRCHLIDGTPIHPLYAVAASATATFRRIVYSAKSRPIDVSYDSRSFPDWMRDVNAITTNGRCSNPVCDAPFHWLHGDHIEPFSHSQDTSLTNERPVCEPDNLWRGNDVSRGKWKIFEPDEPPPRATDHETDFERVQYETQLARARIRDLCRADE